MNSRARKQKGKKMKKKQLRICLEEDQEPQGNNALENPKQRSHIKNKEKRTESRYISFVLITC